MQEVEGYLSRDDNAKGGHLKFWEARPTKRDGVYIGRDVCTLKSREERQLPVFNMTEESFLERYGKGVLPAMGKVDKITLEID